MSVLGVYSFDAGESVNRPVPERLRTFYRRVGAMIGGQSISFTPHSLETRLAIPNSKIKDSEYVWRVAVHELNSWGEAADIVIADLANPPRSDLPNFNLISGLLNGLTANWWSSRPQGWAVILLPRLLSPDDVALQILKPHTDGGRLTLIDPSGRVTGRHPAEAFTASAYVQELKVAQEDVITLIEQKLIRRIGHFKRAPEASSYPTKYFYDGSYCAGEIAKALETGMDFGGQDQILVHAPISAWLTKVSGPLAVKYSIELLDLKAILEDLEVGIIPPVTLSEAPVVLLPLVDSGNTLVRIAGALKAAHPNICPRYISILATMRAGQRVTPLPDGLFSRRSISTGSVDISFDYLLDVEQVYIEPESTPSALREHSGSSFDVSSESPSLTSFAFWDMVETSGWKGEDDVPHRRQSLGSVPDFPEILKRHGPFLAFKIDKLLRESRRGLPVDPVFVCPQEEGAIEVADSLGSMFGYSSIHIPREVLEDEALFARDPIQVSDMEAHFPSAEWLHQLRSAGLPSARAILMDEFRVSGGTFDRLERICRSIGLPVEKRIALADFGTEHPGGRESMDALYRIPLLESS